MRLRPVFQKKLPLKDKKDAEKQRQAIDESKDRIIAAIKNSSLLSIKKGSKKIVVSLAPADLKKEGPAFDLGIALGFLRSSEMISFDPKGKLFLGELSLDGGL